MKIPLRQDKSRKGGGECDLKPFVAVQRVQLPPGRGEPASRKRALQGWWQHHSGFLTLIQSRDGPDR
jgi:hypothetical protein